MDSYLQSINIEKTVDCKQKKKMVGKSFLAQNVKYMCTHEQHRRRGFNYNFLSYNVLSCVAAGANLHLHELQLKLL